MRGSAVTRRTYPSSREAFIDGSVAGTMPLQQGTHSNLIQDAPQEL